MVKDRLKYEALGSICCGERIIDPGNTGEWLCSSCKEPTSYHYIQEIDIAVLDFANSGEVHIHRIEYDSVSIDYDDLDWCVDNFLYKRYGNTSNLQWMYDQVSPIKVLDYRLETDA